MAVKNFVPTIWSAQILQQFREAHVLANLCNRNYEGEIKDYGDTVKINSIGDITISDYTKDSSTITPQKLISAQTLLLIDTAKSFSFEIDDIDQAQVNADVMAEAMRLAGWGLSETLDTAVGALYSQADSTVTDAGFQSGGVALDTIAQAAQALNVNNVPSAGRWLVLPPWAITKLILTKILDSRGLDSNDTFANGMVGRVMGFDVYMSNNLTQTGTDPDYTTYGMAGTREAITLAEQIVKVEAFRPETSFHDAVKGLHVYGMKVVKPKALVQLALTYEAETS